MTIRIGLVDDQQLVRAGFQYVLEAEPDLEVVGTAGDGRTALAMIERTSPDVVLMDIRMPEMDGIQATRRIVERGPLPRVLVLTTFDADAYLYDALAAGATGFLLKDAPPEQLAAAVRTVAAGDALLDPTLTRRLITRYLALPPPGSGPERSLTSLLTLRELDVLRLVGAGLSNSEIAADLFLGETTVKTHLTRVLTKTGCRDRVQAVVLAHRAGLVGGTGPAG